MTELRAALEAKDLTAAMNAVPWDKLEKMQYDITPELQSILNKSGAVAAKALLAKGINISFDQTNPAAVEWVRAHAAELVTQNILPGAQESIRLIIQRAFDEGIPPYPASILIREHIGILPRHVDAVIKYQNSLIDKYGIDEAARRAGKYADKLLRYRAKMISRTECIRASNVGQQILWQSAVDKDLLRPDEWEREWIADETERTCEVCQGLDGKTAALIGGTFPGGYEMPPDPHPQCRCSVGLVRKEQ
jgi:hypothetical protein